MGTLTAALPAASSAAVTCNLYASPSGSDSNPGTSARPFATVQQLDNSLGAGQTGCLMGGTYGNSSTQTTFSKSGGVTVTSYPGQTATIDGYPLITGAGTVLSNLNIDVNNVSDGTHCAGESQGAYSLQIEASNVTIQHDNIYQTDVPMSLRGVGIGVGWNTPVSGVVISNDRIHDFGHCQDLDHGIYVDQATGTQIFGNWIYNIPAGAGIQLYPHPQGSHVYSNIIDHAGIGFFLGDEAGTPAANNQIDHNVISNSTGLPSIGMSGVAISTYWGGSVGPGNTFTTNDSYNNNGGTTGSSSGVTITGTITTDPQYTATTTNNYQIASNSPLASWGLWNGDSSSSLSASAIAAAATAGAAHSAQSSHLAKRHRSKRSRTKRGWRSGHALERVRYGPDVHRSLGHTHRHHTHKRK